MNKGGFHERRVVALTTGGKRRWCHRPPKGWMPFILGNGLLYVQRQSRGTSPSAASGWPTKNEMDGTDC